MGGKRPGGDREFRAKWKDGCNRPAQLHTNDSNVKQNDVIMDRTNANNEKSKEIDFSHRKEASTFGQSGM